MAGYRVAGERAIRIDMLERLADMIRQENTRAGFEAKADMLSITGLTLEQFAALMEGLGYRAERGERPKARPDPAPLPPEAASEGTPEVVPEAEMPSEEAQADSDALTGESAPEIDRAPSEAAPAGEAAPVEPEAPPPAENRADAAEEPATAEAQEPGAEPDVEVFYTFTWGGNRGRREGGGGRKPGAKPRGKPQAKGPKGKRPEREKPASFEARPQKKDRIDPDNPFAAALMGLKIKD